MRRTLGVYSFFSGRVSVGGTVGLSIVTGSCRWCISNRENGKILVNDETDHCRHRSAVGLTCLNFAGCRPRTVKVSIPASFCSVSLVH